MAQHVSTNEIRHILRLYAQGFRIDEIAGQTRRPRETVSRIAHLKTEAARKVNAAGLDVDPLPRPPAKRPPKNQPMPESWRQAALAGQRRR